MFLLNEEKKNVIDARLKMDAALALDKHCSDQAKTNCKNLILSAKGLGTIFVSGVVKGAFSDKQMSGSKMSALAAKYAFAGWLA